MEERRHEHPVIPSLSRDPLTVEEFLLRLEGIIDCVGKPLGMTLC